MGAAIDRYPVPAWMVSASVAANIMMLIPATIIGINTFGTLSGRTKAYTPEVLFTVVGLACFLCVVLQGAATPVLAVTHFLGIRAANRYADAGFS